MPQPVIDGVSQPGAVEVQELPVSSFLTSLGEGPPAEAITIGNGIQVSLTDGAELAPNSVCSDNGLPPPCGGSLTVSLSYANGPPDLNGQDPLLSQYISIFRSQLIQLVHGLTSVIIPLLQSTKLLRQLQRVHHSGLVFS